MQVNEGRLIVKPIGTERVISGGIDTGSSYVIAEVLAAGANSKYREGDKVMYREYYAEDSPAGTMISEYDVAAWEK